MEAIKVAVVLVLSAAAFSLFSPVHYFRSGTIYRGNFKWLLSKMKRSRSTGHVVHILKNTFWRHNWRSWTTHNTLSSHGYGTHIAQNNLLLSVFLLSNFGYNTNFQTHSCFVLDAMYLLLYLLPFPCKTAVFDFLAKNLCR